MKFVYGGIVLSDGLGEGAAGVTLNGQQINERADFIRALAAVFFARGGRSAQLSFGSTKTKDTLHAAERFTLEHFDSLPQQADLMAYIGTEADGEWVKFASAVIDQAQTTYQGVSVGVQYAFSVTAPQFSQAAPDLVEPDTSMLKRSSEVIPSGDDEYEVEFPVPFGSTPIPVVSVSVPDGGAVITARVKQSTVTAAGFTALLSAPTPGAGYYLNWIAMA